MIGAGVMGADHVRTLHRSVPGVEVSLVADLDPERAASTAQPVGARATTDPADVIAGSDAVIIASHDSTHAELVLACLAAGRPVLCEKPLAPTVAECGRIVEAEGDRGLIALGFMRRFDPAHVELKAAIGRVGAPLLVHCVSRNVSSAPGSTTESSITNSAIHEFDSVPWLLDSPITEVSWHAGRSAHGEFQDPQVMLLRTGNGVLTTLEVFLNARYGYETRCEVVGEEGAIALTDPARVVVDHARTHATGYAADWRPRYADAYREELQAWVGALAAGLPNPLATARDGLRAAAVAEAVIASMKDGRPAAVSA
ncbi:Gfo/Idh/MocA family oxidoreductase [Pseudonocardia xishanensis]|uniref:Gfo/Idh/MocA family oxidoreductase n=1 Tax=Pseudonocardia xishanensis TaxID=630995 RepID=A0ABP8RX06_9PSEU